MLQNWLKIYWAHTLKNKVFFIFTIIGLAIGIWGVLLSYLYYQEEVRYDQWNPNKDNVFLISTDVGDDDIWMLASFPLGPNLKERELVEDYMYLSNYSTGNIEFEGEKKSFEKGLKVQANFLDFFPFKIVAGINALNKPNTVMVLDTYAEQLFGDNSVGKTFIRQNEFYTIEGLYSFDEQRSSVAPNIIFSGMEKEVIERQDLWGTYSATLYLKLNQHSSNDKILNTLNDLVYNNVYVRLASENGKTVEEYLAENNDTVESFDLFPLSGQHMIENAIYNGTLEKSINSQRLYILIGLSITILILSVINYVNLSIVQSLKRHKEMGIRLVIGSKYSMLFWQLFVESVITLLCTIAVSFVLVELSIPTIRVILNSQLEYQLIQAIKVGLFFVIVLAFLLATILLLVVKKVSKLKLLKGQLLKTNQKFSLRYLMLMIQFAIASFFMISTFIVYKQTNYMLEKDLGFSKEQVLILPFLTYKKDAEREQLYELYKTELLKIPGIEGVGSSSLSIGGYGFNSSFIAHQDGSAQTMNVAIDEDFLEIMDIKLIEGRKFQKNLATDTISNVLINKMLKDKLKDENIVGKTINWNQGLFTVIGVVDNYHINNFKVDYEPMIFVGMKATPWLFGNVQELYVKVNSSNVDAMLQEIEKVYKDVGLAEFPFHYEFLDQRFERIFKSSFQERNILLVLSVIVIFIALFGLYSLASFTIANKHKEIAIRKVLGADNFEQMKQLSKQYIVMGIIGFCLAVYPSYYFMNAWLSEYAFRITISVWYFLYTFLTLMSLVLIIVWIKAKQATKLNVLKYIKYE